MAPHVPPHANCLWGKHTRDYENLEEHPLSLHTKLPVLAHP
jgi:hypothetical protein